MRHGRHFPPGENRVYAGHGAGNAGVVAAAAQPGRTTACMDWMRSSEMFSRSMATGSP
jgi:hypothetical protein